MFLYAYFLCFIPVPSQVAGLSVTQTAVSGKPALRVSWSRPQSDATITRYEVQYRVSNSGSWATMRMTGTSSLTTTLTTLVAGRSYDVQVRAVSSFGNGAYSSVQAKKLDRGEYLFLLFCCATLISNGVLVYCSKRDGGYFCCSVLSTVHSVNNVCTFPNNQCFILFFSSITSCHTNCDTNCNFIKTCPEIVLDYTSK